MAMLSTKRKHTIISKHGAHETDTGSPEVQAALLSEEIKKLSAHLKKHAKDVHSRRGLLKMVADRRSILQYLARKDKKRHEKILASLGLK